MKYPNDSVYKKALLEKARTYVKNKKFRELFEIKDLLEANGGKDILKSAAKKMVENDLKNDRCKSAIYMSQEYNVTIAENNQKKFFECLSRLGKYKQALAISKSYVDHKDLSIKLYWLYQTLQMYSKLGNSIKVLELSEDIEKLSGLLKIDNYNDIAYNKVEAYFDLRSNDELMLQEVKKVEKLFPNDIKNIDLFSKVVRYAKKNKNDTTIAIYTKKIIDLQERYKLNDYSPLVELDYINALKRLKQYDKALKEDLKLLYVKLTDKQKANVLYVAGELSLKLDKIVEAREFFTKCGEIVDDSAWQGLCAESLKLLQE
jgi:tetratricopeptide (TPR) repeat protein